MFTVSNDNDKFGPSAGREANVFCWWFWCFVHFGTASTLASRVWCLLATPFLWLREPLFVTALSMQKRNCWWACHILKEGFGRTRRLPHHCRRPTLIFIKVVGLKLARDGWRKSKQLHTQACMSPLFATAQFCILPQRSRENKAHVSQKSTC